MRRSVIRYFTNAQRPTADAVRGIQMSVAAITRLNASSTCEGFISRHTVSPA